MNARTLRVAAVCLLAWGCGSAPKVEPLASTVDPADAISKVQNDMASLEQSHADILAPKSWAKASEATKEAAKDLATPNTSRDRVMRDVETARGWLKEVKVRVADAQSNIPDLLEARRLAMEARASEYASREWDSAESAFRGSMIDNEESRTPVTAARRNELRNDYLQARITSLQNMYLGDARAGIHEAELQKGMTLVPHLYGQAVKSLHNAEGFIATNSTDANGILILSLRATNDANRLLRMTKEAVALRRATPEQAALALDKLKRQSEKLGDVMDQQTFEKKFDDADSVFSADEAEVYKQGNQLVLKLKGVEFPFGRSALPPQSYALLSKTGDVIKSFGNSRIVIQGHADSIGGAKVNEELSRARADAVKSYLVANSDLKEDRMDIEAMGYEKPVASNKSMQGRAENRRVDIIIIPDVEPGTQVGQSK